MNFDFSADQHALRADLRRLLEHHKGGMRRAIETGAAFDAATWQALRNFGAPAIAFPEALGGLGLGYLELCVVAEELGRALTSTPLAASTALFAEFLRNAGELTDELGPALAAGSVRGALAFAEAPGDDPTSTPSCVVTGGKLSGRKVAVVNAAAADAAIVTARAHDDRTALYLVDLTQPGVTRHATNSIDPSLGIATLEFKEVVTRTVPNQNGLLREALDRAAVLIAFEQLGGAEAALGMARDYALTRSAFGRSIGSFQAIKHMLADMYVSTALAKSNCYYAAWALSTSAPELRRAAAAARLSATAAYQHCARNNIQVHGGMGFTWETDCHLHYRRANALSIALGPARLWENTLVDALDPRAA